MIIIKNANGYGTVIKLQGNRRKPYACRKTVGKTEKGYPKYKYISYHKTKREALNALREYNADPYNLNQKTFAEIYELWFEHQNYSDRVGNKYKNAFKRCEPLHKLAMSELTLPRVQAFFDSLEATAVNVAICKTLLKGMIDYSIKRGLLPVSAKSIMELVEAVPRKETTSSKREAFTKAEIEELWKNKDDKYTKLILFYIYTGLRFSELSIAEWHEDYLDLKKSKTKAGIRLVPLSDKAKSLLPLPELPGHRVFYDAIKYRYNHMPHDTRHTFISLMTEAGVDSRLLKKIVGHATDDVTEAVYTHISMEAMLEAINKI
mgnify:CR=1 FL=1